MSEIFELSIWTYPGLLLSEVSPDLVTDPLRSRFEFDSLELMDQFPTPDPADVKNLALSIREGEIKTDEFLRFCFINKLSPNIDDPVSAVSYLGFRYGYEIAWLNVPYTSQGLTKLNKIAESLHQYRATVVNNDNLYCYWPYTAEARPIDW